MISKALVYLWNRDEFVSLPYYNSLHQIVFPRESGTLRSRMGSGCWNMPVQGAFNLHNSYVQALDV